MELIQHAPVYNILQVKTVGKTIVMLWVYYTIPFGVNFFRHFWDIFFNLFNYFLWLRITDDGSIPEMRTWSIS